MAITHEGEIQKVDGICTADTNYYCNTDDTKPTEGIANGSRLFEMDATNSQINVYLFDLDNTAWVPAGTLGGS